MFLFSTRRLPDRNFRNWGILLDQRSYTHSWNNPPSKRRSVNMKQEEYLSVMQRLVFLLAIAGFSSSAVAFGQAGHLDSTFGTGGIFTTNFTQADVTIDNAVAIQSDGKIVLGGTTPMGSSQAAALLRLDSNGTLDPSFGTGGIVN